MKNTAVILLCILLFVLLCTFGLAFTVHQIALSPVFVTSTIDSIDFSKAANDLFQTPEFSVDINISQELQSTTIDTLDAVEPVLKDKINIFIRDVYDYVLNRANAPDPKGALKDSFLNPDSVSSILEKVDLPQITDDVLKESLTIGNQEHDALRASIVSTVTSLESTIKQEIVDTSDPILKYLLGEAPSLSLKTVLRQNVVNKAFITEMINALDIKLIAQDVLGNQVNLVLPLGITLNGNETDQIIAAAEPAIKQALISAADPIADYLLGIRSNFTITAPWKDAITSVKPIVRQAFLRQLPSALSGASPAQIDMAFETYWAAAQSSIPTTFSIGSSAFGADLAQTIGDMMTASQDALTEARNGIDDASSSLAQARDEARPYINLARFLYWSLILLILLVIGAVILIRRSVKGATRDLGITFTVYGILTLIGVLVLRAFLGRPAFIQGFGNNDIPDYILDVISPIIQRLTQPLFIFTIICLIIGIALLVVYFVYPRKQPPVVTSQTPTPQS